VGAAESNLPLVLCVTRFNWPHPSWKDVPDETYSQWLETRFRIFEKFTRASITNCYVKPDLWLLLTSRDDLGVSERLASLCRGLPAKVVAYNGLSLRDTVRNLFLTMDLPSRLMTVRLDSDDIVAANFFASLKQDYGPFSLGKKQVVSYPLGAVYVASRRKFFVDGYVGNPFIGLVEDIATPEDIETVYLAHHYNVHNIVPIHHNLRCHHPTWASVLHDSNLANESLLKTATFSIAEEADMRKKFGLKEEE
jgi:hypothetical protein